ncbi:peptide chain release factor N(5)-glutamine methyltransferase [Chlamydia ibidis]|nr:peptide chain release factor N(5)-glutamine methyltransferase [Chlamydia ibidis]
MEVKKILSEAEKYLDYHGIANPRMEAEYLLMDCLGIASRCMLFEISISTAKLSEYWLRLGKRACHVPLAYIHGEVRFLELELEVNTNVLIPRMETELLADRIIQYIRRHPEIQLFYDVCCGSGCLGLAIKKACPNLDVVLSDICPKAVELAKCNAKKNQLSVEVLMGDLFAPYTDLADAFVCNPPYLALNEIFHTDPEVRCHEPWKALVAGSKGIEFYERIACQLSSVLRPKGVAWLEIGYKQGAIVKKIFSDLGVVGEVYQDLSGLDRIFFLENHGCNAVSFCNYS